MCLPDPRDVSPTDHAYQSQEIRTVDTVTRRETLGVSSGGGKTPAHDVCRADYLPYWLGFGYHTVDRFACYVGCKLLFERVYSFDQYKVGMAFGPLVVGSLLASRIVAAFDKFTYEKARAEALRLLIRTDGRT